MAEGARLESVYTGNRIVGSNPTPSAKLIVLYSESSPPHREWPTALSSGDKRATAACMQTTDRYPLFATRAAGAYTPALKERAIP